MARPNSAWHCFAVSPASLESFRRGKQWDVRALTQPPCESPVAIGSRVLLCESDSPLHAKAKFQATWCGVARLDPWMNHGFAFHRLTSSELHMMMSRTKQLWAFQFADVEEIQELRVLTKLSVSLGVSPCWAPYPVTLPKRRRCDQGPPSPPRHRPRLSAAASAAVAAVAPSAVQMVTSSSTSGDDESSVYTRS